MAVSAATILLRILGLIREIVLAAAYGAGTVSDAYIIATTVPSVILLVIGNAVTATYIPQCASHNGDKNQFTSSLLTMLFIVGFIFAFIFTLFPQALVYIFASKLAPDAFDLASKLLQVMVWSAIPMLLIGIFRAYLQIKKIFFVAIASDALINFCAVISIILGKFTESLILLGIGVMIGNIASMAVLVVFCKKKGLRYYPRIDFRDEHIRNMLKLMLPITLAAAVLEINQIIDKNLAASLVSGTVATLSYSSKLNNVVTELVGSAVTIALFPRMSELAAEDNISALKKHLIRWVITLTPMLLPLTVGMVLIAKPIVQILLERGAFEPEDTQRTAECLQMYALSILATNFSPLFIRGFHAMKQAKIPAILSAISVAGGIALKLSLIGTFQHRGLALGTSVTSMLYTILLVIMFRKTVGALGLREQVPELAKITFASATMGVFVWFAIRNTPIMNGAYMQCLFWTVIIVGIAVILYGGLLVLLKVKVITGVVVELKKKMSR
jgi:putative peptidoglycan lipid II flippase